jgi:hypothetical protein
MKNNLLLATIALCFAFKAPAQTIWANCSEDTRYYRSDDRGDRIRKHHHCKFCYNEHFFGFEVANHPMEVIPLEMYKRYVKDGIVTEHFINGPCDGYERGDLSVTIEHDGEAEITIRFNRHEKWVIEMKGPNLPCLKSTAMK